MMALFNKSRKMLLVIGNKKQFVSIHSNIILYERRSKQTGCLLSIFSKIILNYYFLRVDT